MPRLKGNVVYMSDDLCSVWGDTIEDLFHDLKRLAESHGIDPTDYPDILWMDVFDMDKGIRLGHIHHNNSKLT